MCPRLCSVSFQTWIVLVRFALAGNYRATLQHIEIQRIVTREAFVVIGSALVTTTYKGIVHSVSLSQFLCTTVRFIYVLRSSLYTAPRQTPRKASVQETRSQNVVGVTKRELQWENSAKRRRLNKGTPYQRVDN